MYKCKDCEKWFMPTHSAAKYVTPTFCSKSCKTRFQMTGKDFGYRTKADLEKDILRLILAKGCYLTLPEITKGLNVSSKTLNKFKVSVLKLNQKAGMSKPASVFECRVKDNLSLLFPDYEIVGQATFNNLLSPKGFPLRFDFLIEGLRLVIEADGVQHVDKNNYMSSDYTILCDRIKEEWCLLNGYTLVRIPYSKKVDLDFVKQHIN